MQNVVVNPLDNYIVGKHHVLKLLEKTIGKGTFGKVKLGIHKAT